LFDIKAELNSLNVLLADVDIKDALIVNFEKKIKMFPPVEMQFSSSGFMVLDIISLDQIFA
jgi:hypothetical protein